MGMRARGRAAGWSRRVEALAGATIARG
jgi:hypothetical protein